MRSEGYGIFPLRMCVCFVYLSVTNLAKVSLGSTLRKKVRIRTTFYRLFSVFDSWIFGKKLSFKSYSVKKAATNPSLMILRTIDVLTVT